MIISLSGKKRSGKGTVAAHLVQEGWVELSWAQPLKEVIGRQLFGLTDAQMYGSSEDKEALIPDWNMSARQILQVVGTDLFRRHICDDFWVRIGIQNLKKLDRAGKNVVISDTRFPNEADAVRQLGGYLLWVERRDNPHAGDMHPSETALDGYKGWNLVVSAPEGQLEDLCRAVGSFIWRESHLRDNTGSL